MLMVKITISVVRKVSILSSMNQKSLHHSPIFGLASGHKNRQ